MSGAAENSGPISAGLEGSGLILGRYLLGSRIGVGAAGSVFRATDIHNGQLVVVKLFDGQEDGYSPWQSEMRLALRFRHPNIVTCLGTGFDESRQLWILVFELAAGGSLRRALVSGRTLSPPQVARVLRDVAAALSYAHNNQVIHRDVKPENVLAQRADEDSPWLLTDFGAGRFLKRGEYAQSVVGSTLYMAPEVFFGQTTAASDQYSLGIMGLELWSGQLPDQKECLRLLSYLGRRPGLAGVIARLTAQNPHDRFADMSEALHSLMQVVNEMSTGGDLLESLRQHLRRRGLSELAVAQVIAEWGEQGSILTFLVGRKLLDSSIARMVEAVQKGYIDRSLESVLGLADEPPRPAPSSAPALKPPPSSPIVEPPAAVVQAPATSPPLPPPAVAAPVPMSSPVNQRSPLPASSPLVNRWSDGPQVGARIGRYQLQELLGQGATAKVFRSYHDMLNVPLAIKVFEPIDGMVDPDGAQRFRREAQTLFKLEHPHIVRVLDVDIDDGYPFILMEYVGETTLGTQIQNLGRLPAQRIAQIGIAVASALDSASQFGLLHRDVKPSNILERKDGHIKLVDFGISATRSAKGRLDDPKAALGLVSGTPSYIAPEQAQRPDSIDFRADMYSLGATLYHAAVGRPPFNRATAFETITAHIEEEPTAISQLEPSFDLHLSWTIHRMLRKNPDERFPSWLELRDALQHTLMFPDQPEISTSAVVEVGSGALDTRTAEAPVAGSVAGAAKSTPAPQQEQKQEQEQEPGPAGEGSLVNSDELWRPRFPNLPSPAASPPAPPSLSTWIGNALRPRFFALRPLQQIAAAVSMALISLLLLVLLFRHSGSR